MVVFERFVYNRTRVLTSLFTLTLAVFMALGGCGGDGDDGGGSSSSGPLSRFVVSGFPAQVVAGTRGSITVEAVDASGRRATYYSGTVHFSANVRHYSLRSLPQDYTFTAADAGIHTFVDEVVLKDAGVHAITVVDDPFTSYTGSQQGITVTSGPSAILAVSGYPNPSIAGAPGSVTVEAQDAFGNRTEGYTGTVSFTSSDPKAILPPAYTFLGSDAGTHMFASFVALKIAGGQTITATDTGNSKITGSQTLLVAPAAPAVLVIQGYSDPVRAGDVYQRFQVEALDSWGNRAEQYTGTVSFSSSDAKAGLPSSYTFMTADAGIHDFGSSSGSTVVLKTVGDHTITVSDVANPSLKGSQQDITVTPGPYMAKISFGVLPPTRVAAKIHWSTFTVRAEDEYGNFMSTNNSDTVSLSAIVGGQGVSLRGTDSVKLSNGVATFADIAYVMAGAVGIKATAYGGYWQSTQIETALHNVDVFAKPVAAPASVVDVGRVGAQYNATLIASGGQGDLAWASTPTTGTLPPGLSINSTTGKIAGTASTPGRYLATLRVTDAAGSSTTRTLRIAVEGWINRFATGQGVSMTGTASRPCLAVDSIGNWFVAWQDTWSSQPHIFEKNTTRSLSSALFWGGLDSYGKSFYAVFRDPVQAINGNDQRVRAWRYDTSPYDRIFVSGANGAALSGNGIDSTGANSDAAAPSIAIGPSGYPCVAWQQGAEIYVRRWDGTSWAEVGAGSASGGGISNGVGSSGDPSVALDASENPVVAWDNSGGIYVKRWNGVAWVVVGAGSTSGSGISLSSSVSDPRLALDMDGNPIVAWEGYASASKSVIYIRRYSGAAWVELGNGSASGAGISNSYAHNPSLVVDRNGNPVVAWAASGEIYARRWTGAAWVDVGMTSLSSGGISSNSGSSKTPSLAIDRYDSLIVAWEDTSNTNPEIYLKEWPWTAWVDVGVTSSSGGGISGNSGESVSPRVSIDDNGRVLVAWQDTSSGNAEVYVKRWDGTIWADVGSGSTTGGGVSNSGGNSQEPCLAVEGTSGDAVVAWSEDSSGQPEIYVKRWNGTSWGDFGGSSSSGGGISGNTGGSRSPAVAIEANGNPVVAWADDTSGNNEIFIKRWNGTSWVGLGSGSATGGGVSSNGGDSNWPSLVLDLYGSPFVAWEDGSAGNSEVYVKHWDGTLWAEVGAGSASGGGVSNNAGRSERPSLALDAQGYPIVVWQDNSSGNYEIYVTRWNGVRWVECGNGSGAGGGISNNSGASIAPALVADASGSPVVVWQDATGGNYDIYVRRWDGAVWKDVGSGSSTDDGISHNAGSSEMPSVAVGSDGGMVVVWQAVSGGNHEIFAMRGP